jgi:hypothetical protein
MAKVTVEGCRSIDVLDLHREGRLRPPRMPRVEALTLKWGGIERHVRMAALTIGRSPALVGMPPVQPACDETLRSWATDRRACHYASQLELSSRRGLWKARKIRALCGDTTGNIGAKFPDRRSHNRVGIGSVSAKVRWSQAIEETIKPFASALHFCRPASRPARSGRSIRLRP